jgi:integrase
MRKLPSLRRHTPTSQAVVTLAGKDHYLGVWPAARKSPPPPIQRAYERLIAEWLASDRRPLASVRVPTPLSSCQSDPSTPSWGEPPTVAEILAAYWGHAEVYYSKPDGSPSPELHCLRAALAPVRRLYDDLPAREFTPKKLAALREAMIEAGLTRSTINRNVGRVKRVFKWAVANELVPPSVSHGLQVVAGLKAGRSGAREGRKVRPVAIELVERTLPTLPPTVARMVEVQLLTGMRSTEVCRLRPCDLDRSSDVWVYRLPEHKCTYRGQERVVAIGPRAQAILVPLLVGLDPTDFVFSPSRSEEQRRAMATAARKTPRWRSHMSRNRRKRKASPRRTAGQCYTRTSYGCAVARGCVRAFPLPAALARGTVLDECGKEKLETVAEWKTRLGEQKWIEAAAWRSAHFWSPHRLRHQRATEVRDRFGLDAAQAVLGHNQADVTQLYAQVNLAKAAEVARLTG